LCRLLPPWLKWLLHSHPSLHLRQPLQPVPIQRYRHLQRIPLSPHLQKMFFLLPKVPLHLQKVARLCRLLAPWLKWLLHIHPSLHLRQPLQLQPVPIQRYRHLQRIPWSPHIQKMFFLLPKVPLHMQKVARLCRLLAPLTTTTSCSSPSAPALFKTPCLSGEFRVLPGRIRVLGGMAPLTRWKMGSVAGRANISQSLTSATCSKAMSGEEICHLLFWKDFLKSQALLML